MTRSPAERAAFVALEASRKVDAPEVVRRFVDELAGLYVRHRGGEKVASELPDLMEFSKYLRHAPVESLKIAAPALGQYVKCADPKKPGAGLALGLLAWTAANFEKTTATAELDAARPIVQKKAKLDADLLVFSKRGKAGQLKTLGFDHDLWDRHAVDYFRKVGATGSASGAEGYVLDQLTLEGANRPKPGTLRKRYGKAWQISRRLGVAGS